MKKMMIPTIASMVAALTFVPMMSAVAAHAEHMKSDGKAEHASYKSLATETAVSTDTTSPFSGYLTTTSNYVFRGVSSSNNLPAMQGSLTWTFLSTGIYLNLWGSNVNFADTQGNTATVEFDTILGISNPIGEHFKYDLNIARYNYPKAASSYNEVTGNLAWYFLTGQIGYSTNVYNSHGNGTYYNIGFNYDIPSHYIFNVEDVNVKGGVGHYSLPKNAGLASYNDYNLQVSKAFGPYVVAVQWTDTNGRSVDAPALRDSHLIGSFTVNF